MPQRISAAGEGACIGWQDADRALTALVKDELSRLQVTKPCCRKAEVSAMLRFASGLHIAGGRIVVEAEVDTPQPARRLRKDIHDVFGHGSDIGVLAPG